jgi:hypothetical protein
MGLSCFGIHGQGAEMSSIKTEYSRFVDFAKEKADAGASGSEGVRAKIFSQNGISALQDVKLSAFWRIFPSSKAAQRQFEFFRESTKRQFGEKIANAAFLRAGLMDAKNHKLTINAIRSVDFEIEEMRRAFYGEGAKDFARACRDVFQKLNRLPPSNQEIDGLRTAVLDKLFCRFAQHAKKAAGQGNPYKHASRLSRAGLFSVDAFKKIGNWIESIPGSCFGLFIDMVRRRSIATPIAEELKEGILNADAAAARGIHYVQNLLQSPDAAIESENKALLQKHIELAIASHCALKAQLDTLGNKVSPENLMALGHSILPALLAPVSQKELEASIESFNEKFKQLVLLKEKSDVYIKAKFPKLPAEAQIALAGLLASSMQGKIVLSPMPDLAKSLQGEGDRIARMHVDADGEVFFDAVSRLPSPRHSSIGKASAGIGQKYSILQAAKKIHAPLDSWQPWKDFLGCVESLCESGTAAQLGQAKKYIDIAANSSGLSTEGKMALLSDALGKDPRDGHFNIMTEQVFAFALKRHEEFHGFLDEQDFKSFCATEGQGPAIRLFMHAQLQGRLLETLRANIPLDFPNLKKLDGERLEQGSGMAGAIRDSLANASLSAMDWLHGWLSGASPEARRSHCIMQDIYEQAKKALLLDVGDGQASILSTAKKAVAWIFGQNPCNAPIPGDSMPKIGNAAANPLDQGKLDLFLMKMSEMKKIDILMGIRNTQEGLKKHLGQKLTELEQSLAHANQRMANLANSEGISLPSLEISDQMNATPSQWRNRVMPVA